MSTGVVDVFIAVDVPFVRAVGVCDINAVRFDITGVVGNARGEDIACPFG